MKMQYIRILMALGSTLIMGLGSALSTELKFVSEPLAPFIMQASGTNRVTGPMADVLQAVCERIRSQCSVEVYPWRRAYKMVESGEVDGILPFFHTLEREKIFFMSDVVVETAFSVFAMNASNLRYSQPRDLDGLKIGVYGPSGISSTVEALLKSGSTGKAEIALNNLSVLRMLAAGRYGNADTAVGVLNRDVGLYLMNSEGIQGLKVVGDLQKVAYAIGLSRKKVTNLQFQQFNDALKALTHEGTIRAILDKYGMKAAS